MTGAWEDRFGKAVPLQREMQGKGGFGTAVGDAKR